MSDLGESIRQARTIERFWRLQGYTNVTCKPVQYDSVGAGDHHGRIWGVQSNLVNGLPPKGDGA